jgi:hypothetical protein
VATAVGNAVFDSTTLANGVHTIAWIVTDNLGTASGIGSRYFTVSNGSSLTSPQLSAVSAQLSDDRDQRSGVATESPSLLVGRRGLDPYAAYETFDRGSDGRITIEIAELGRVELWLGAGATGHALVGGTRQPLPIGSQLDRDTGRFTWNPGVGFVGTYEFVFGNSRVRIVVNTRTPNRD